MFGNANHKNGTIQLKPNDDFLEVSHYSNLEFPEFNSYYFPTFKIYNDQIYCFNGNRDKLFRFD